MSTTSFVMSIGRPKKWKFAIITSYDSLEPLELSNVIGPKGQPKHIKFIMGKNEQPGQPLWATKSKGIAKLSEVIKIQNEGERQCS